MASVEVRTPAACRTSQKARVEPRAKELTPGRGDRAFLDDGVNDRVLRSLLAYRNLRKGLSKLRVNEPRIEADLAAHFEVVAEAVQIILRRTRSGDAYEKLKRLTRGQRLDPAELQKFVDSLDVDDEVRRRITSITPTTFVGPVF